MKQANFKHFTDPYSTEWLRELDWGSILLPLSSAERSLALLDGDYLSLHPILQDAWFRAETSRTLFCESLIHGGGISLSDVVLDGIGALHAEHNSQHMRLEKLRRTLNHLRRREVMEFLNGVLISHDPKADQNAFGSLPLESKLRDGGELLNVINLIDEDLVDIPPLLKSAAIIKCLYELGVGLNDLTPLRLLSPKNSVEQINRIIGARLPFLCIGRS